MDKERNTYAVIVLNESACAHALIHSKLVTILLQKYTVNFLHIRVKNKKLQLN